MYTAYVLSMLSTFYSDFYWIPPVCVHKDNMKTYFATRSDAFLPMLPSAVNHNELMVGLAAWRETKSPKWEFINRSCISRGCKARQAAAGESKQWRLGNYLSLFTSLIAFCPPKTSMNTFNSIFVILVKFYNLADLIDLQRALAGT